MCIRDRPNRLATLLDTELVDESRGGGGSIRAMRMCMEYINKNLDTIDDTLFIIETTSGYRDEIFSNRLDRAYAKALTGDSPGMAAERLRAIVDVLRPEEFSQLIINFDVNPLAEQPIDDDRFNAGQDIVPNDYIRKQRERFTISLRLPISVLSLSLIHI